MWIRACNYGNSPELPFAPGMSCLSAEKIKKKSSMIRERSVALKNSKVKKTWVRAAIRKLLNVTAKF